MYFFKIKKQLIKNYMKTLYYKKIKKQSKNWFIQRVGKSIYSYKLNAAIFISTKYFALLCYDNQTNDNRRYEDLKE
jgi:hypothetical protein